MDYFVWLLLAAFLLVLWQVALLLRACRRANRVDWGRGWMNLLDGLNRLFCYRYHRLNVLGLRLPRTGRSWRYAPHWERCRPGRRLRCSHTAGSVWTAIRRAV